MRALKVAITLLAIYAIATPAQAQYTVEVSYLIPIVVTPSETGGGSFTVDRAYEVQYGQCEAMLPDATAALRAHEMEVARDSGRTQWVPASFAVCLEAIKEILWNVVPVDETGVLCVRAPGPDVDWNSPCP